MEVEVEVEVKEGRMRAATQNKFSAAKSWLYPVMSSGAMHSVFQEAVRSLDPCRLSVRMYDCSVSSPNCARNSRAAVKDRCGV